jgi:phosphoenolpyruvate-protein kinase (PTS system EI component)
MMRYAATLRDGYDDATNGELVRATMRAYLPNDRSLKSQALNLIEIVKASLRIENLPFDEHIKIGGMIEVPAAVYLIDALARRVDFLSVGTNDLVQYLLAVDRNNARVVGLYDAMHPAVLAALAHVVRCAKLENKSAGVCGEVAGDPMGALLLIAMGYDSLSMNASNLPRVKALIRSTHLDDLRRLLKDVLGCSDVADVHRLLNGFVTDPELRRLAMLDTKTIPR